MQAIKVSVIMPVYKVEEYVGKAIESIQQQTLENWELFAVDDGSPDNSGAICDEYAARDPRVKVIHKENGGAHTARNAAIDLAVGKYLYFMDSDDWCEPTMLEDMVSLAEQNEAELVVAGFYIDTYYSDAEKYSEIKKVDSVVFKDQNDFRFNSYRLFDKNLLYTPWNKLYLASYIKENNIYFPLTFWDDFPFNLLVIRNIRKVVVTDKAYYHFLRKREESETAKYRSDMYEKREEENTWLIDLYKGWDIASSEIQEFIARRYIERLIGCVENLTNPSCQLTRKEKKLQIKAMIQNNYVKQAVRLAEPESFYLKIMFMPIAWGNVLLTYLEGSFISSIKRKNVKRFAKLKSNR